MLCYQSASICKCSIFELEKALHWFLLFIYDAFHCVLCIVYYVLKYPSSLKQPPWSILNFRRCPTYNPQVPNFSVGFTCNFFYILQTTSKFGGERGKCENQILSDHQLSDLESKSFQQRPILTMNAKLLLEWITKSAFYGFTFAKISQLSTSNHS